jgi:elongation factor Ts
MPSYVATYMHGEGAIGVLVELRFRESTSARTSELQALGRDLAMHIAAMQPKVVHPAQLNIGEWSAELERISASPSIAAMLPEERVEALRMAREKYEDHFCLLKQPFIKSSSALVEDRIAEAASQLGEQIEVVRFTRFAASSE